METSASPNNHLLLSIAFSHYVEKARWALAYYHIPYTQHLLLPVFHVFSVKSILAHCPDAALTKPPQSSPFSTPLLVVYESFSTSSSSSPPTIRRAFQSSHDILVYLSSIFSTLAHPSLYTSCGADQADKVSSLEEHYDSILGVAARKYVYYDMLVLNKYRALLPFATVGFANGVGWLQAVLWFVWSPLIGRLLVSRVVKASAKEHGEVMERLREEFGAASLLLEKSTYLAGDRLSAADITFAALSYPALGITHAEGYQQFPPGNSAFSVQGHAFMLELRATKAGQHVLRLYKEERYFGGPAPRRKRTKGGLW